MPRSSAASCGLNARRGWPVLVTGTSAWCDVLACSRISPARGCCTMTFTAARDDQFLAGQDLHEAAAPMEGLLRNRNHHVANRSCRSPIHDLRARAILACPPTAAKPEELIGAAPHEAEPNGATSYGWLLNGLRGSGSASSGAAVAPA